MNRERALELLTEAARAALDAGLGMDEAGNYMEAEMLRAAGALRCATMHLAAARLRCSFDYLSFLLRTRHKGLEEAKPADVSAKVGAGKRRRPAAVVQLAEWRGSRP